MAKRRRSKIGKERQRKIGTEELKRIKYSSKASSGNIGSKRFGFSSRKNGKLDSCVFYAKFAAKKFLDLIIQDDDITWVDDTTIVTSSDVTITGPQLNKIHSYKITYNENRYHELSEDHQRRALIIRSDDHAKPFITGESITHNRRHSRKGMTLMKAIAEEVGMTPRAARGILRAAMKKPSHGWAWQTQEEVDKIKALLIGKPKSITVDFSGVSDE